MKSKFIVLQFLLLAAVALKAQITISGPACVKMGTEYQYVIQNNANDSTAFTICISGGSFKGQTDSCVSHFYSGIVQVYWTDEGAGSLTVTSSTGSEAKNVFISAVLQPGMINSPSKEQTITQGTSPDSIKCSLATKGSCDPAYTYQWQQSSDKITWTDISGKTNSCLKISSAITEPMYYRRKVTETTSGTVSYSDIASVYVNPVSN